MNLSLCIIERNEAENLEACINHVKPLCDQVVVIDQSSDDGSLEIAQRCADIVLKRRSKGYADPDRNLCYSLAKPENWVLALDPDERLSDKLKDALPQLLAVPDIDIYWIPFENYCDGQSLHHILGDDYHPRLFRKGALTWPSEAHAFPARHSVRAMWLKREFSIIHTRTYKRIQDVHAIRSRVISPQAQNMEASFIQHLNNTLGK